jgi:hypothetical protein
MRLLAFAIIFGACNSTATPPAPIEHATPPATPSAPPVAPDPAVLALNQRTADTSLPRNARCAAVFELFDKHLAAGVTASIAGAIITERAWMVVDQPVVVLAGKIPVELTSSDSTFVVHCCAEPTARLNNQLWSDWVIYGRLSGRTATTLGEFLAATTDVRLIEYALSYPDGRVERYTPTGRKSMRP